MTPQENEILLVEDDPADAELTVLSLRKERLANHIEIARDGAEALDYLFCRGAYAGRSFERPPRLVLLDLKLPRVSGHEVLRAIKADERTRSIPVVVLTSSDQERDQVECYGLGVNSYIEKPVDLQKFQEVVRQFGMYWLMVNQMPPSAAFRSSNTGGAQ
jgi:two-component system, response regulator